AGPILSLIQGLLAGAGYLVSKRHNLTTLFLLWFAILGFNNFLGYLMTGFLFQQGDIGKFFLLFNISFTLQLITSLIAALILLYIAYKLTMPFLKFSYNPDWVAGEKSRVIFSFHIIILPWIIGSIIVTIAYLPVQA